ncbi:MBOAT family O-acyltransferase [Chryseobacterium sp. FH1]|uniref:MBOAT family O-acyltransferase n=1 Tax=Chryseobacterium sp. FH1 TaxID=1233951 RepID=UPI0004E358CF|nr:MBOAT family O-acyltransferase [Chryseobacterium sp. FH1]KFC24588.1 acyltransferase [Chryseobacterium sp. FH1]
MFFNSLAYACFLPFVFVVYWFVLNTRLKFQNIFLLAVSYYFYSCWDWRFVFLLAFSTALDYYSGIMIYKAKTKGLQKFWLILSVGINLGFLGFFKYYNFFIDSFSEMLANFGFQANYFTLSIILPVGISFYTFHGLSYVFDIYNKRIQPTFNIVDYTLFVSFFPLLVAGPIERATHLLPQIEKPRVFDYTQAADGLRQILWGLFKKMVIADNCAVFANQIFNDSANQSGSNLVLGAVFFAFQIYGDFSGYSDIALGSARLLGIELLKNFNFPYFSRDIAEFWRRWHISLSSWFKDYLYIPLGGSKGGNWMRIRNTFIIFVVSGFWHGSNWTFIVWGALNALFIVPSMLMRTNRNNIEIVANDSSLPNLKEFFQMLLTFALACFAWIFFRAESVGHAIEYISGMFSKSLISVPSVLFDKRAIITVLLLVFFIIIEWSGRRNNFAIEKLGLGNYRILRWGFYAIIIFLIGMYMPSESAEFIYFQF